METGLTQTAALLPLLAAHRCVQQPQPKQTDQNSNADIQVRISILFLINTVRGIFRTPHWQSMISL